MHLDDVVPSSAYFSLRTRLELYFLRFHVSYPTTLVVVLAPMSTTLLDGNDD